MGIISSNKTLSNDKIRCGESFKATLAIEAAPDIVSNPTDIVLLLDRSGSMKGTPLKSMKLGAKTFIDIIYKATDTAQDGNIGSGSRIGIVSFASTAMEDTQLITSAEQLNDAVDALEAGGNTNHADAFEKAIQMVSSTTDTKVIVMFTDGNTTRGGPPAPVAAAAKAQGITIYCIGLVGSDGVDVNALNEWASDPDDTHVAVTPDAEELEKLFADIAKNITITGATNIVIEETVNPEFEIESILLPTKGYAVRIDTVSFRWRIRELGVAESESAEMEFVVRYRGQNSGTKKREQINRLFGKRRKHFKFSESGNYG